MCQVYRRFETNNYVLCARSDLTLATYPGSYSPHRLFVQQLEVISFHVVVSPHGSLGCANANSNSCPAIAFATLLRADDVSGSSETCDCRKDSRAEKTR